MKYLLPAGMSKRLNLKSDFTRFLNDPTFPYKVTVCIGDERILCSGVLLAQRSLVLEQKFREDDGVLLFDEFLDVQNSRKSLQLYRIVCNFCMELS